MIMPPAFHLLYWASRTAPHMPPLTESERIQMRQEFEDHGKRLMIAGVATLIFLGVTLLVGIGYMLVKHYA